MYNVIWKYTWAVCKCTFEKYRSALEHVTNVQTQLVDNTIKKCSRGCRDKSTCCSPKRLRVHSQHSQFGLETFVEAVDGDLMLHSGCHRHYTHMLHIQTHIHKTRNK